MPYKRNIQIPKPDLQGAKSLEELVQRLERWAEEVKQRLEAEFTAIERSQ